MLSVQATWGSSERRRGAACVPVESLTERSTKGIGSLIVMAAPRNCENVCFLILPSRERGVK
jgi:hypothetical protein